MLEVIRKLTKIHQEFTVCQAHLEALRVNYFIYLLDIPMKSGPLLPQFPRRGN